MAQAALMAAVSAGTALYTAKAGKPPKPQPKPLMPDPNDPSAQAARQRKEEELRASKGRQSTVLDEADDFAAPAYSSDQLGL